MRIETLVPSCPLWRNLELGTILEVNENSQTCDALDLGWAKLVEGENNTQPG